MWLGFRFKDQLKRKEKKKWCEGGRKQNETL